MRRGLNLVRLQRPPSRHLPLQITHLGLRPPRSEEPRCVILLTESLPLSSVLTSTSFHVEARWGKERKIRGSNEEGRREISSCHTRHPTAARGGTLTPTHGPVP